ncbi:hypothetical protein RHMOL_Rhmol10G0130800 [Rhododendron molle]|uniref:Uncharacterized protein n=1 Tax=Rhododendron molle TaxID=49168 RepID=A0ACC0M2V7_RHOML|nr:hypothetical protein RHMOL_Rhmol10G0130800 [Rhododendron molle]
MEFQMTKIGATGGSLEATVHVPGSLNLDAPQSIDVLMCGIMVFSYILVHPVLFKHTRNSYSNIDSEIVLVRERKTFVRFAKKVDSSVPTVCGLAEPTLREKCRRNLQHLR